MVSAVTGCVSISAFASLVGIPIRIANSSAGSKIFAITAGIEKYKSNSIKVQKHRGLNF